MTDHAQDHAQAVAISDAWPGSTPSVARFSHDAMATTFEIIARTDDPHYAQQASEAAFEEIDRLEQELSRFVSCSDITRISESKPGDPVAVGLACYECLQLARLVHERTGGAFDVTTAALLDCWREPDGSPRTPTEVELAAARTRTGMDKVAISEDECAVGVDVAGVSLDLGGIGKGYALDHAGALLLEWNIEAALLHAAQSTMLAVGTLPGTDGWPMALRSPDGQDEQIGQVCLRTGALSGSGLLLHGRHIIDARTGRAVDDKLGTWAAAPTAALADAMSTAFMVMPVEEIAQLCDVYPEITGATAVETPAGRTLRRFGDCAPWLVSA